MKRKNCWEVKKCGRQPGGDHVGALGVCPAAMPNEFDNINRGTHGGRICWAVVGTLCQNDFSGTFAQNLSSCLDCKFLDQVHQEESRHFILIPPDIEQK